MARGVVTWSQTASSNDVADTGINWAEGQAPSSVNDSARAMMASVAKWRDDIAGVVLVTAGSGTAYTLTTNQVFAANNNGNTVQFTPGSTNTGAVTLAVDSLSALPLRFLTGTDLPAGVLISGSLYQATLRSSEWLLHSSPLAQPFLVPIGGIIDYAGSTAPNANFVLPQGQAISTTTYATLYSLISTTYNTGGEVAGTFRVPDLVGRVTAMIDAGSARLSSTYFGGNPANLGAHGGLESELILQANLPSVSFSLSGISVSTTISAGGTTVSGVTTGSVPFNANTGGTPTYGTAAYSLISAASSASGGTAASGGSGTRLTTVQPTYILNKIMRVL
jgi:microcystin-dependent protein